MATEACLTVGFLPHVDILSKQPRIRDLVPARSLHVLDNEGGSSILMPGTQGGGVVPPTANHHVSQLTHRITRASCKYINEGKKHFGT